MSRLLITHLKSKGCHKLILVNRNIKRALNLAVDFPDTEIVCKGLNELDENISISSLVFTSTASEEPIIDLARIEKLKEKYRIIRDQKIRERVEALGVKIQGDEDRETLLQKEKEYTLARQKIEFALESFYRSASSLVFQLNKRHITRDMSIFRCIDRRFETGEIFVKWDEASDDEWLLLIYIKNNSPDEGIVIEDKTNPEKNISHEFKNNEIFKASDTMVDALTQLIGRKRAKNIN